MKKYITHAIIETPSIETFVQQFESDVEITHDHIEKYMFNDEGYPSKTKIKIVDPNKYPIDLDILAEF